MIVGNEPSQNLLYYYWQVACKTDIKYLKHYQNIYKIFNKHHVFQRKSLYRLTMSVIEGYEI